MLHPESLIDFKVYEDKNEYLGIAQVGLPDISYITQTITGAGIAGNVEAVLIGMLDVMTTTMQFRSCTEAAAKLAKPTAHQIDLRVAEQYWDSVGGQRVIQADKYVLRIIPGYVNPGLTEWEFPPRIPVPLMNESKIRSPTHLGIEIRTNV